MVAAGCVAVGVGGLPLIQTSAGGGAAGEPRVSALAGRLSAGVAHTCVVEDRGRVVCWGEGAFGALGYGNVNDIGDNEIPADNPAGGGFVAMPGGQRARSVGAGGSTTCAVVEDGRVACWGLGSASLGYGNSTTVGDNETPAQNSAHGGFVPLPGRVETLAVGLEHRCAVLVDGGVACWGKGEDGRLGYGNTTTIGDDETPTDNPVNDGIVPLPNDATATAVTAGGRHTCALLDTGAVACWGANDQGQLGYGNTTTIGDDETPADNPVNDGFVPLPNGATAVAITAGDDHTCALLDNGQVSCWGDAANGRLGYANTNDIGDDETPADNPIGGGVVPLIPGRTATQIVAGGAHTCAILDTAGVTCWGAGSHGQLGHGSPNDIGDNEFVSAASYYSGIVQSAFGRASTVAAGGAHTCLIAATGLTLCWGRGAAGRLGRGATDDIGDDEFPAARHHIVWLPGHQRAVSLATGDATCVVLETGDAACRQLGEHFVRVDRQPATGGLVPTPEHARVVQLSRDIGALCALLSTGRVTCRPPNPVGVPGVITLPGHRTALSVSVGGEQICAVLDHGGVTCWGSGMGYGVLWLVVDVPGLNPHHGGLVPLPGGRTATAVTSGETHTCALLVDGNVTCWGKSMFGQLGYGNAFTVGDDETPAQNPFFGGLVPLPGGRRAISIDAGGSSTCAILEGGLVTCWGHGGYGQLGYGNTNNIGAFLVTPATNPVNGGIVPLPAGRTATKISVGREHTCALLDNGAITCWGLGADGRLGYGNTHNIGDDETVAQNPYHGGFVPLPGNQTAIDVSAGVESTCALLTSGGMTCWGSGDLGYGAYAIVGDDETPAQHPLRDGMVPLPNPISSRDLEAVAPARLADTRPGFSTTDGLVQGGGPLPAETVLAVPVRGRGGLPGDATTAILSVSAVSPEANGFVTAYPCDQPRPTAANLNYQTGVTVANTVAAALSRSGEVCIYSNRTTHLVVDIHAFVPPASALVGLTPSRLVDTRPGFGTIDGQFAGQGRRSAGSTLAVTLAGRGPLPATARTVALNVAAVQPSDHGFITVHPCDQPRPNASSLNYRSGTTTANFVYTTAAGNGTICVYTNRDIDLVVDVVAHHRTGPPRPSLHHALPPTRLVDTRPGFSTADARFAGIGPRGAGSTLVLPVGGRFPVTAARIAAFNITAVAPTANGFITVYPCDQPRPIAATFNFRAGITRSVGTLAGLAADGTVCVFTNQTTHLVVDVNGTTL